MAGSYLVTQLQSIVARNLAPTDVGVVSVSMFNGGSALNQVPDKTVLGGTTRAMSAELGQLIRKRMETIIKGTSEAFDMPMKLEYVAEAPGVIQNEAMRDVIIKASQDLLGEENVDVTEQANMAGEDFSAYTQKIPGYFLWLGIANNDKGINAGLHTIDFDIDPRACGWSGGPDSKHQGRARASRLRWQILMSHCGRLTNIPGGATNKVGVGLMLTLFLYLMQASPVHAMARTPYSFRLPSARK